MCEFKPIEWWCSAWNVMDFGQHGHHFICLIYYTLVVESITDIPFPPTDPQRPAPLSPGLTHTTVCVQGFEYLHVSYLVKFFLPSPFPLRSLCLFRASNTGIIYKNRYIYPNQFSSLVYYSSLSEFARIFWTSALLVEFKMSQVLLFTDNASVGIRAFVFCTYVDISVIHCCMTTYHRS